MLNICSFQDGETIGGFFSSGGMLMWPILGCSVVPGMSAILANMACARTVGADLVRICITPGTRRVRGPASFARARCGARRHRGDDSRQHGRRQRPD